MVAKFKKNDVVQFNENHKWCARFGIIDEIKEYDDDVRYMIGVPVLPDEEQNNPIAYIFVMESDNAIEYIGRAILGYGENDDK